MTLTNDVHLLIRSTLAKTVGLASVSAGVEKTLRNALATADALFTADTVLEGTSDDFDLVGALTDPAGAMVTFAKVMLLLVTNKSTHAMTLGGTTQVPILAGTTPVVNLPAGASLLYLNPTGVTVTASTGDLLTLGGTSGDAFELLVVGAAVAA